MALILVADNEDYWLNVICGLVRREHFGVIRATNEDEARSALDRRGVDLAILDLRLKDNTSSYDISGFRVAKETDRSIPKIIVSNYASESDFAIAYPAAFKMDGDARPAIVDFVEKGRIEERLIPAIENALKIKTSWSSAANTKISRILHEDYESARKDAKRHHQISSFISIGFAAIFFWGAWRLHSANMHSAIPLILTIVGVLVAEVTNYLFSLKLEFLYDRVERYHEELLESERFSQLIEMSHTIRDETAREAYKLELFRAATSRWIHPAKHWSRGKFRTQPLDSEAKTQILPDRRSD